MNKMKPHGYNNTTQFLQEKIKAILEKPTTSRKLSVEAEIDFTHVQYHLKKLIERKEVLCIEDESKPPKERWVYMTVPAGEGGKVTIGETSDDHIEVSKYTQAKPKGAMGRVENLAGKLKKQAQLINSDRRTAIQRNRGGCGGISQVYEG